MRNTLTYTGSLVTRVCWCGIHHAIPSELDYQVTEKGTTAYCPLGHEYVSKGESEGERYKRLWQQERDRLASRNAELDQAQKSLSATKGVVTKMKKRIGNGACPYCHRHFTNVERHMASKHTAER